MMSGDLKAEGTQRFVSHHDLLSPVLHYTNMSPINLKRARSPEEDDSSAPLYGTQKKVKTSLLADDDDDFDSFDKPHDHFVLCGRGEKTNRWPGNKAFRRVVEANRAQYHAGPRRNKTLIARSIVEAVQNQNPPGLFVRKDTDSGLWVDIGKKEAIKKTSQALREDSKKDKKPPAQDEDDDNKDDDDNETNDTGSSYGDGDGSEQEDQQDEAKPPALARSHGFHGAHQGGFASGAVSPPASERGDREAATAQEQDDMDEDDFDRMIDMCKFTTLAHDADFEPLSLPHEAPLSDFSRSSSKGSEDGPLPTSLVFQTSIDSSIASVVSRDGDSETEDFGFSKSLFADETVVPHCCNLNISYDMFHLYINIVKGIVTCLLNLFLSINLV